MPASKTGAVKGGALADYLQSVMRSLWWRRLDGFALLFFTGLATMTIALRW